MDKGKGKRICLYRAVGMNVRLIFGFFDIFLCGKKKQKKNLNKSTDIKHFAMRMKTIHILLMLGQKIMKKEIKFMICTYTYLNIYQRYDLDRKMNEKSPFTSSQHMSKLTRHVET
ncbi:CLUMA_CG015946, isoform A [Clunio marinus]|uniref:CLUMA_CG015946, isoform A n=1 Tax=Clunio marinus TaxID=568069 RepID=A0A1J1IRF4_9DIPT|nr:CLUMA_CG015946, isoform A [Clunio marinus]